MDKEQEKVIAEIVESCLRRDFDVEPGAREEHDGKPGKLEVDFVYPSARPAPFALEITRIVPDELRELGKASKLQTELDALAKKEKLGCWYVIIRADALPDKVRERYRTLKYELASVMRHGQPVDYGYTSDDLFDAKDKGKLQEFVKKREEFEQLGLQSAWLDSDKDGHGVKVMPMPPGGMITGFSQLLMKAIEDNVGKLEKAKRQSLGTQLAVFVERFDVSIHSEDSSTPRLPETIDLLWVAVCNPLMGKAERLPVWSVSPRASCWREHDVSWPA